jgi:hypothetical protein
MSKKVLLGTSSSTCGDSTYMPALTTKRWIGFSSIDSMAPSRSRTTPYGTCIS